MAHIIHQRLDEIFDLVQRSVHGAGYAGTLSGGLVLTGGGATMTGTVELAADVFGTAVRVGRPGDQVGGLRDAIESPRFATVAGLALYGASRIALGGAVAGSARRLRAPSPGVDKWAQRVKTWLQDFF
jgi:cell division protein FtsA